jgi:integrase
MIWPAYPDWTPENATWHLVDRTALLAVAERLRTEVSPATGRRVLGALRGILKECWLRGDISRDEFERRFEGIKIRGERVRPGRALTPGEIEALTRDAGLLDRALILTMVCGGLRRAEAAGLKYRDVIFGCPEAESIELGILGKGNKERLVYLTGRAASALAAWMAENPPALDQELVFGLSVSGLAKRLHAILSRVHATSHDLRRTYASAALDRGVDLATVQQVLGHEDPRTTAQYDRRGERSARAAAQEVDEWLGK